MYIYEVKKNIFFVNYDVCNIPKIATLQSEYCYGFQNFLYEPKQDFSSGLYHGFRLCLHPGCIGNPLSRVENRRSKWFSEIVPVCSAYELQYLNPNWTRKRKIIFRQIFSISTNQRDISFLKLIVQISQHLAQFFQKMIQCL